MTTSPSESAVKAFNLGLNQSFNEQFNRDFAKQSSLLEANPKFLRTRQSIEAERLNNVGARFDLSEYQLFQENKLKPTTIRNQILNGIHECNLLQDVYFSPENIEYLQSAIRYQVWLASNKQHVISRQSDEDLQIIMRSIYLQYGKNLPTGVKQQIRDLNDLVIQDAVSKILSQVQQHVWYLWQFSRNTPYMPNDRPRNMSSAGLKVTPSVTSLFYT
jgi:hypothetical protein